MEAWWGASQASGDDEFGESTDDEPEIVEARKTSAEVRGALRSSRVCHEEHPQILQRSIQSALRLALREITESEEDHARSTKRWKLLMPHVLVSTS